MLYANLPRQLKRLVIVSLTLLGSLMITDPSSRTKAQLPTFEEPAIARPTTTSPRYEPDYSLGGGDRIRLDIFEVPQYSGEYQIPPGGVLNLPLIGSVSVEGLTLEQASQTISSQYASFLKRPLVTLTLLTPRPLNVSVSGEVNRPGSYALSLVGGAGSQPGVQFPNLAQAIEQAGGITLSADIRRVQLRRLQRLGSEDVITIDLLELVQTGNSPQNLKLRDGDTIFIPTSTNVTLSEIQQIAATGFAPKPDEPRTVAVVGEVTRPGSYVVIGGNTRTSERTLGLPTVTRAIQLAGGIKPMANIRQIQVRRLTRSGTEQIIAVDLWQLLQSGDFNQDTILQDRDTIFVPTAPEMSPSEATELATVSFSPDTIQVSVVGEVIRPGVVQVPPNTPLNQALLTAGGFDQNRASKSSVELIRLNPDGTVSKRTVPIDLAQGINEESNPILRNNDIIVVDRSNVVRVTDSIQTTLQPVDRVFGFLNILRLLGIFF